MRKLSVVLLLLLAACNQPATSRPQVTGEEIRAEEARQKAMIDEAAETGGAPRPWRNRPNMQKQFERVAERIEAAAARMCQEMGLPKQKRRCYYYFDTDRSLDINAHADGKYIIVSRGMLRFIDGDDEMAVVLGHEMAHNMMGHIEAGKENAQAGQFIGAILGGMAGGSAYDQYQWQRDGAAAGALAYSVSFEEEADYVGLYITSRAGYPISRAPHFWRRMSLENPDGVYNSVTHPSNAQRFVALEKTVEEIQYKRKNRLPLVPELSGKVIDGDYEAEKKIPIWH